MIEDFNDIIDMRYDDFLLALRKPDITSERDDLLNIAKASMETNFRAIKLSFNRIEGLQETPIEFEIPKFYVRYINATSVEPGDLPKTETIDEKVKKTIDNYDPSTAKLRQTLTKMRSLHKDIPAVVMSAKEAVENGKDLGAKTPTVKAIICANLILLSRSKINIVEFVLDQIYGKLTQKIKLLNGEDIYIDNYHDKIAPLGSYKDENGKWLYENKTMQLAVIAGFARQGGKYLGLEEYLNGS